MTTVAGWLISIVVYGALGVLTWLAVAVLLGLFWGAFIRVGQRREPPFPTPTSEEARNG